MAAESGEDWVLVLSDDDTDDKEVGEAASSESTKPSAEVSDASLNAGAQNRGESVPGSSAGSGCKGTKSKTEKEVDNSAVLQSDQPELAQEQSKELSKSSVTAAENNKETGGEAVSVKQDVSGDSGGKSDGDLNESSGGQSKAVSKEDLDRNYEREKLDTGDESEDSDQTIVMGSDDIEKAVDKIDQVSEVKDSKHETGKPGGADGKSVDVDSKGQTQPEPQKCGEGGADSKTGKSEGTPPSLSEKESGERETFRSLDLPIHPVNEKRRSRAKQRSEEHRLERSPSVASNRSEDSSCSSNKQHKKEGQMTTSPRERRKSGASSTKGAVKMTRPGFELKSGFKLQAQDFSDKWYPAKIVKVDEEDSTVLIHFDGWNSRFDEWMDYKSNRLRPAPRRETSPEKVFAVGDTVLARWSDTRYYQGKIRGVNSNGSYRVRFYDGLEKSVQAGNIREMPEELRPIVSPKGYGIGDEVLARWNDCRYYPAKILSIKKNGAFRVLFYDGIEKSVQPFNVREMSAELKAQDFFKQFKAQIKASEEKNRKRERRKREEAAVADGASSVSKEQPQRLKRRFSPPPHPVAKRTRHDSMDSSKTGSSIAEEKDVSREKEEDLEELTAEEVGEGIGEHEVRKVVLKRGIGYYIDNFVYIKNRESSVGLILRCQNRNRCHGKAVIKENGKAVIRQSEHSHDPPAFNSIEFYGTHPEDATSMAIERASDSIHQRTRSTESSVVESSPGSSQLPSPTTEGGVTPVIQMLTAGEVEKMRERRKHIREPLIIDSALGVLSAPTKLSAPKALIIDLDHNKYKCEVPECGKSFRKATLLEYHKKYYHIKQTTPSGTTAAAGRNLSRSRKRLTTSPTTKSTTSSSRRSSEESTTPAKVTRSQRSSAPSELGLVSPTREAMSPPISSPAERKKSIDGRDRRRERSGDKKPEVRVAKTPQTRSPIETKSSKLPETRIPKSPETRLDGSSDGKLVKTTPESRGSRSLSAESRSSPTTEGRTRRLSAPDRTRQLSGSSVVKPPETVPEQDDSVKLGESVEATGPKVGAMEGSMDKADEVMGSKDTNKENDVDISRDTSKHTNNKDINIDNEAKTIDDVVIKQEPKEVKLVKESPKILEATATATKQAIKPEVVAAAPASSEGRKEHAEVTVEKEKEGKSRSERAKLKHKKKHKHKHDKGKDERSRDRHKAERRRKSSEKAKLSDIDISERSDLASVKDEPEDSSKINDIKLEDTSSGYEEVEMEEEKELINCVCGYLEEEGFMLQCERCYCWQHGCCEGVNQSTAPKHYVCTFCRHPRGERVQSKYRYDQEWFKTGKLLCFKYVCQEDIADGSSTMLTSHNLMADVQAIHDVLHGLQHKMMILKNPNHPELALWAHPWRTGEEWSYDGQAPSDTMDTSAQDTDLSNMDTSNLDTVPNSMNTSIQSVEAMDTSITRDTDMDKADVVVTDEQITETGDMSIKCAVSGDNKTQPELTTTPVPTDGSKAQEERTPKISDFLPDLNETTDPVEKPKATIDGNVASDETKKDSVTILTSKVDAKEKSDGTKEPQSTPETCDRTTEDSTKEKIFEEKVTEMEKDTTGTSDAAKSSNKSCKPSQESDTSKPSQEGGLSKPSQEAGNSKPSQEGNSNKTSQEGGSNKPSQEGGSNKPSQEGSSSKPSQEGGSNKPSQEGSSNKPSQEGSSNKPSQESSSNKPSQESSSNKPSQESSSNKPSQERSSNKPSQVGSSSKASQGAGSNTDDPSISTSSSFAELSQLDPSLSGGSVFGVQAPKDSKPSTSTEGDGQSKQMEDTTAVDVDKPGPSGLQQSIDIDQPGPSGLQQAGPSGLQQAGPSGLQQAGPSGLQQPPVDADIPGPSGLQATDIPSTSGGDNETLPSHLLSEGKVTGSSVWTPVQANLPSTSAPAPRHAIPPPAVCQANLMEHIQTMHEELFDRLALVEEQIEALEVAYAQKHEGAVTQPSTSSEQESLALKRKMAVLMADLEKLSNIDLTNHN